MTKKNFYVNDGNKYEKKARKKPQTNAELHKHLSASKITEEKPRKPIEELIKICVEDLEPREDRVIIYQDAAETKTRGGLYKADISIHKPSQGTVMVVGPGIAGQEKKMQDLKSGDHVLYGRFAGVDIEWQDEVFIIVRQSDILLRERKKSVIVAP